MGNDGNQKYTTKYYNLDVILSVGYRVNSLNATLFRQWANKVLKEYLLHARPVRPYGLSHFLRIIDYFIPLYAENNITEHPQITLRYIT